MPLPDETRERIKQIIEEAETPRSALIPALWAVQKRLGWLSTESMAEVAGMLGVPPASVQNVATFYTMFFTKPVGKHTVWVCGTLSCALRGAGEVEEYICRQTRHIGGRNHRGRQNNGYGSRMPRVLRNGSGDAGGQCSARKPDARACGRSA